MTQPTDLADECGKTTLLHLYRSGQASPIEATRAVLGPHRRPQPDAQRLSAMWRPSALASAFRPAQRAGAPTHPAANPCRRAGVSIKDLIPVKGWPDPARLVRRRCAAAGTSMRRSRARLHESGAVLLGHTPSTLEFGCKGETNPRRSPASAATLEPGEDARQLVGRHRGRRGLGAWARSVGTDGPAACAFWQRSAATSASSRASAASAHPLSLFGSVAHLGPAHHERGRRVALLMNVLESPTPATQTALPFDPVDYSGFTPCQIATAWHEAQSRLSPTLGWAPTQVHLEAAAAAVAARRWPICAWARRSMSKPSTRVSTIRSTSTMGAPGFPAPDHLERVTVAQQARASIPTPCPGPKARRTAQRP